MGVGVGVTVALGVGVGVDVGVAVGVAVGADVGVGVGVWIGVAVGVGANVAVGVGVGVGVDVGVGVGVAVAVAVGVGVTAGPMPLYPITSITWRSMAVSSSLTPISLRALKQSLVPLAQSCKSVPGSAAALLNSFGRVAPASKEKNLPPPLFKPRLPESIQLNKSYSI